MKTTPENKKSNPNSKFTRNRNQDKDVPASAGKIKKRIRDVKRTLSKKKDVSAEVIIASKRRLRALEFELGEKMIDEQERSNATKYHKVKHFERKKTQRKLNQAKRQLEETQDPTKKASIQQTVDDLEIKLLYTTHYPKTLPYVSLYPSENIDDKKSVTRKDSLLKDIKQALLDGDSDLKLLLKKYRNEYKQKLIKRGDIPAEAPVDDEEIQQENNNEKDNDDFFEAA